LVGPSKIYRLGHNLQRCSTPRAGAGDRRFGSFFVPLVWRAKANGSTGPVSVRGPRGGAHPLSRRCPGSGGRIPGAAGRHARHRGAGPNGRFALPRKFFFIGWGPRVVSVLGTTSFGQSRHIVAIGGVGTALVGRPNLLKAGPFYPWVVRPPIGSLFRGRMLGPRRAKRGVVFRGRGGGDQLSGFPPKVSGQLKRGGAHPPRRFFGAGIHPGRRAEAEHGLRSSGTPWGGIF